MSMSGKETKTFLTGRKRKEAALKECHLSRGCDFAGDYWPQMWSWRAGRRKEAGDMENVSESGQAGFDPQSCPLLGPGNSGKLFNLLRKPRLVTSPLRDLQGDTGGNKCNTGGLSRAWRVANAPPADLTNKEPAVRGTAQGQNSLELAGWMDIYWPGGLRLRRAPESDLGPGLGSSSVGLP